MRHADLAEWFFPGLIMIIAFMLWAMVHVWSRHAVMEIGYELSAQQSRREQLTGQNRALRIEISTLRSPKRLEQIAQKDLGLTTPRPEQVVYIWSEE